MKLGFLLLFIRQKEEREKGKSLINCIENRINIKVIIYYQVKNYDFLSKN